MSDLYRIRPLAWVEDTFPNGKHIDVKKRLTCQTAIGKLILTLENPYGKLIWTFHHVGCNQKSVPGGAGEDGAKKFAEDYYVFLMKESLERVE